MVQINRAKTYRVRRDVSSLVSFRLTDEMKERVDDEAERMGLTRSELLRLSLDAWLLSITMDECA
jgi:predicted DNA-binding protein